MINDTNDLQFVGVHIAMFFWQGSIVFNCTLILNISKFSQVKIPV